MKRYSSASLALAVVVVLGLSSPVAAGEQVPFKGSFKGDVTITPLLPPSVMVDIKGSGKASHLGKFTVDIPHVANREKSTAIGKYEFTAANGDTLTATFTGKGMPTATPGVIALVETATITGGTGRFAGATGSFTVERLFDRAAGTTVGSFKGVIGLQDDDEDDD